MRRKTRQRMLILLAAVLVLCGAATSVYVIGARKTAARVQQARVDGMAAYRDGDYGRAVRLLGHYLDKARAQQSDPEALYAYGRSRMIHEPNVRHRLEAVHILETYRRLKPADLDAQHLLLGLYPRVGYFEEALKLADDVLGQSPEDPAALCAKAQVLRAKRQFAAALESSQRLNQVAPQDIYGQLLTLQLLADQKEDPKKIVSRYADLYNANRGNPRFELLYALALQMAPDAAKAREVLKEAAAHAPSDPELAPKLSRMLAERFGMYEESLALLEAAVERAGPDAGKPTRSFDALSVGDQPSLLRMLLERKWQLGQYEVVASRLASMDPSRADADFGLLALRALSLYELDRKAEAVAVVDALAKQSDDSAVAWAGAIKARYAQPPMPPTRMIKQYQGALEHDPDNAIIHYMLGEAYYAQGELELALSAWRRAAAEAPSWAAPVAVASRALVAGGRFDQALVSTEEARRRSPTVGVTATYLTALYGIVGDSATPEAAQGLLKEVRRFREHVPNELETAHIEAAMLARLGQAEQAKALIEKVTHAQPPPPLPTLLALTRVSVNYHLGNEDELLALAERAHGSRPEIATLQAALLHNADKSAEGLKLLQAGRDKARDPDAQVAWRVAIAQYMDAVHHPDALAEWVGLADSNADKLFVQSAALRSPTRLTDRPFWRRTIDRVKKLTGEEAYTPRIEQARWLLEGKISDKESSEAIELLSRVIATAPGLPEPRRLLANAYEKVASEKDAQDKIEFQRRAVDELRVAFNLRPADAQIAQDLARLLKAIGKADESAAVLDRLAQGSADTPEARKRLARTFEAEGRLAQAIQALLPIPDGDDPMRDAMLAELYRRTGKPLDAAKLYDELLDAAAPDPEALLAAANFFAARDEPDHAQKFLAKMAELPLRPGTWELMMARFAERHLSPDDAIKQYTAATQAQNAGPETWRALANYQLRRGRLQETATTTAQGLKLFADEPGLTALAACGKALEAYQDDPNLLSLAEVLAADPRGPGTAELIKLLGDAKTGGDGPIQMADKLRDLAQRRPSLPLLGHVFRSYMRLGDFAQAAAIAQQAAAANANDPKPAAWLAGSYISSQSWDKALAAARQWRDRSADEPLEADVAIAQVLLHVKPAVPESAIRQLEPHMKWATAGAGNIPVVSTYTRALIATGQDKKAAQILRPLAQNSAAWRAVWLDLGSAAFTQSAPAAAWVEQAAAMIPKDSTPEQAMLADAWYRLGAKFQWLPGFEKSGQVLEPMLADPAAKPEAWRQWAVVSEALGDLTEAERGYRKLLEMQPNLAEAQNNLAYILLSRQQGDDLAQARVLIEKAVAAAPNRATFYDTRARVQFASGQRDAAVESYRRALALDPRSVEAMIGLADLLVQANEADEVRGLLRRINALVPTPSHLPPVLQKQLQSVQSSQRPAAPDSQPIGPRSGEAVGAAPTN